MMPMMVLACGGGGGGGDGDVAGTILVRYRG